VLRRFRVGHPISKDMMGTTERSGLYQKVHEYFMPHMQFLKEAKVVKGDFLFKKRNLKDLPCKIVFPIGTSHDVMVEFDEDIGGCSGDGHGKQGHCVVIDKRSLIKETKRKER